MSSPVFRIERSLSNARGIRGARSREISVECCRRDTETLRDLCYGDVGIGKHRLGGLDVILGEFRRTASGAAKTPRGSKTRFGTLPDQAALEFRQRTEHVKNQPPLRGRRVESFGQAAKPDSSEP